MREAAAPGEMPEATAMELLEKAPFGRVVFTMNALPAIRPVNHIVDGGAVVFRTHEGTAIASAVDGRGVVVAYEADDIDPVHRRGWSVIVLGTAHIVTDPVAVARYEGLLRPWVTTRMEHVVRIVPRTVTGFWLGGDEGDEEVEA